MALQGSPQLSLGVCSCWSRVGTCVRAGQRAQAALLGWVEVLLHPSSPPRVLPLHKCRACHCPHWPAPLQQLGQQ